MTTTSDMARLLMMQGTQLPDAGLGPVTNTTRAGRPNPMLTASQDAPRPNDYMAPVAELLSIPMGAYGAGQLVGSGVNAVSEGDYASGAGQVALGMAGMLPMAPKGGKGIRAFHGSPHDFDKFSMEHIGKGEGAQAYGHGLYFAEAEDVAKEYKRALGGKYKLDDINRRMSEVAREKSALESGYNKPKVGKESEWKALQDEYDALMGSRSNLGHMYEVNIRADPNDFLDWDKPLSQQSEKVRNAVLESGLAKTPFGSIDTVRRSLARERGILQEAEQELASNRGMFGRSKLSADQRDAYARQIEDSKARIDEFERILSGDATASYLVPQGGDTAAQFSSAMREAGIPGIRYLDQMSRGAGEGSSNYVVFDDALVEILRKYGLLGPVAGGGTLAGMLMGGQEGETY